MKFPRALVTVTVVATLAQLGPVEAAGHAGGFIRPHLGGLPPVSGTLHMQAGFFGGGHHFVTAGGGWSRGRPGAHILDVGRRGGHDGVSYGYQGRAYEQLAAGGYGGARILTRSHAYGGFHRYGPHYGSQGRAYRQLAGGHYGYGYAYSAAPREVGWRGDGTGLVGLIGNAGEAFTEGGSGWGTADSATSGGAYPLPSPAYRQEAPVQVAYGEPDLWNAAAASENAPAAELGYYSSGSPGRAGYYSSGSSAGPGGSPGGLGVFSYGAYGPGPRIIRLGHHGRPSIWQGCNCGPHIIFVHNHHRRHLARW